MTLALQPDGVARQELKGTDFDGKCEFPNEFGGGKPNNVTFTKNPDGTYKVTWDLFIGHVEGIGVRMGKTLVAVGGNLKKGLGVVVMDIKEGGLGGVWATSQDKGTGTESWSRPKE